MNRLKQKFWQGLALVLSMIFILPQVVQAQSALDAIKAKLEGEGISVIDYGTPEGQWGALPPLWTQLLSKKGYQGLEGVAAEYGDFFQAEGSITDLRSKLALSKAQKTQLNQVADLQAKQDEIDGLQSDLDDMNGQLKDQLVTLVSALDFKSTGQEATPELIQSGVNLLAQEIDYYYNYNKWGPLPERIVGILELNSSFASLQEMAATIDKSSEETKQAGFDFLSDLFSNYEGLSSSDVELIINSLQLYVAGGLGEAQLNQVGLVVVRTIQNIVIGLAILWIVIAGIRMIFAGGDESVITEQKTALLYGVIGLVVILLAGRVVEVLYGPAGVNRMSLAPDVGFSNEVYGIVGFLKALVGIIAIFFIVLSGVRMLFAQGDEGEITKNRTAILWVGAGLVLIAINELIIRNIFILPTAQSDQILTSNVATIINTVARVLEFLLGFVGLITFGILIYGAASMILNFGNDEMVERAKKIIRNAIIGIIVIISAYVIVASLVVFR